MTLTIPLLRRIVRSVKFFTIPWNIDGYTVSIYALWFGSIKIEIERKLLYKTIICTISHVPLLQTGGL